MVAVFGECRAGVRHLKCLKKEKIFCILKSGSLRIV